MTNAVRTTDGRCIDITELVVRLSAYYDLEGIDDWLASPQKLLGNRSPDSLIAEGRMTEVTQLIDQLDAGAYL
jgi:uncharacterized protein (DUF2384 family)